MYKLLKPCFKIIKSHCDTHLRLEQQNLLYLKYKSDMVVRGVIETLGNSIFTVQYYSTYLASLFVVSHTYGLWDFTQLSLRQLKDFVQFSWLNVRLNTHVLPYPASFHHPIIFGSQPARCMVIVKFVLMEFSQPSWISTVMITFISL